MVNIVKSDDKRLDDPVPTMYIAIIDDIYHKELGMTILSRHRIKGRRDTFGRWRIARTINGRTHSELYPDFRSAARRLCQIAREQRRRNRRRHHQSRQHGANA